MSQTAIHSYDTLQDIHCDNIHTCTCILLSVQEPIAFYVYKLIIQN